MAITCAYKDKVETRVINQKWIMDKFKPFPWLFKYFNETRKKYWKKIFYASNVNNSNNNKMKIQIYKRVYAGSWVERFL